jgi:hypothetical protein
MALTDDDSLFKHNYGKKKSVNKEALVGGQRLVGGV